MSNLGYSVFGTQNPNYINNVKAGEAALNATKYDSCMVYYKKAFEVKQTSFLSTLRYAACAYQSGETTLYKAQLTKAIEISWDGTLNVFENYPEFRFLFGTSFESDLRGLWKKKVEASGLNLALMEELKVIQSLDQAQRDYMGDFEWGSPQMDSLWKLQLVSDSLNTERVVEIIEEYGYPGRSMVGNQLSGTAFLVIQHANQEVQEKYLPVLQAAAGELSKSSLALLIDRVRLGQGKKQIYGSQLFTDPNGVLHFSIMENPYQVDSLRATFGLGPIAEYAKHFGIEWDVDTHVEYHKPKEGKN